MSPIGRAPRCESSLKIPPGELSIDPVANERTRRTPEVSSSPHRGSARAAADQAVAERVAQFGIIVDNENLTRIRDQFRSPQPLAHMVILPADTKSRKDIMTKGDIFPSLLVVRALVRLDDLSEISARFRQFFSVLVSQNFLERRAFF
jgi:hypothetical protein